MIACLLIALAGCIDDNDSSVPLRLFGVEDTAQLIDDVRAGDPHHRVLRRREVEEGKDFMCDGSRCYRSPGNYCLRGCG